MQILQIWPQHCCSKSLSSIFNTSIPVRAHVLLSRMAATDLPLFSLLLAFSNSSWFHENCQMALLSCPSIIHYLKSTRSLLDLPNEAPIFPVWLSRPFVNSPCCYFHNYTLYSEPIGTWWCWLNASHIFSALCFCSLPTELAAFIILAKKVIYTFEAYCKYRLFYKKKL